jgi:outer membrane receptor protein involved in Fe transport
MKTKTILLFVFFTCWMGMAVQAQTKGDYSVKGVLLDSVSKNPEPYATIRILQKGNTKPVAVSITDNSGKFRISMSAPGTYDLLLSSVGRTPLYRTFTVGPDKVSVDFGKLYIQDATKNLKGVEVVAAKPLVKADVDKIEYNISEDPESKSKNMLDMLRKVPMVTVDGDDNIKVNGNSSFKVYVNGKPNTMISNNPKMVLKSFPAMAVKKVEVITNPGAKYDAEGVSGILNIVTDTQTSMDGIMANLSTSLSNRSKNVGAYGLIKKGKLTFSVNYGVAKYTQATAYNDIEQTNFNSDTDHFLKSHSEMGNKIPIQYGNLEGSYEFDKNDLLSVSGGLMSMNIRSNSTGFTKMFDAENQSVYSYNTVGNTRQSSTNLNGGLDFQHIFQNPGEMLTFSYRFNTAPTESKSYSDYDGVNVPSTLTDLYSDPKQSSYEHTGQVDYSLPFKKIHTLSTGVKYIYRMNKSDNKEYSRAVGSEDDYLYDDTRSLKYNHQNKIMAAYAEYKLALSKFSAKAGLRYEYSKVNVKYPDNKQTDFDSNFSDLVPSVTFSYNLGMTKMLSLSYNMRIGRPSIGFLSPYVDRSDITNIKYGNPNLVSEKAHNIGLTFGSFGQKFSLNTSLTYRFSNNGLSDYSFLDVNNVLNTTYGNILSSKALNMNMYVNWVITNTTTLHFNATGAYNDLKSDKMSLHNYGYNGTLFGGIQQSLPWELKLGVNGGGMTRTINLQGKGGGYSYYTFYLSRSFLKEQRLTLSAFSVNLFNKNLNYKQSSSTDLFARNTTYHTNNSMFGISVSLRLGKLQAQVKKVARTISNDDVKSPEKNEAPSGGQQMTK